MSSYLAFLYTTTYFQLLFQHTCLLVPRMSLTHMYPRHGPFWCLHDPNGPCLIRVRQPGAETAPAAVAPCWDMVYSIEMSLIDTGFSCMIFIFHFHISFWKNPAIPFTPIIDGLHFIYPPASRSSRLVPCLHDRVATHAYNPPADTHDMTQCATWRFKAYELHRILLSPQPNPRFIHRNGHQPIVKGIGVTIHIYLIILTAYFLYTDTHRRTAALKHIL